LDALEPGLAHGEGGPVHGNAESAADTTKPVFAGRDTTIARTAGGSLTANWTRRQSGRSQTELRVYFSHAERKEAIYRVSYSTIDLDFHHELTLSESNSLMWAWDSASRRSAAQGAITSIFSRRHAMIRYSAASSRTNGWWSPNGSL